MTPEEYEEKQRRRGLYPDITYGPSGFRHPYDFEPDEEACTPEEIESHQKACEAVAGGADWMTPAYQFGLTKAGWGWGTCRFWFTYDEYTLLIGHPPETWSEEKQKPLL